METQILQKLPDFFSAVLSYIEPMVIVLIILCGIIAKRMRPKDSKVPMDIAVAVLSAVIIVLWAKFQSVAGELVIKDAPKYFFSYLSAIVLYDKLIRWFNQKINNLFKKLKQ